MLRWLINFMISSMIFFPDKSFHEKPEHYRLISEDVFFSTADQVKLHGWFLKAPAERGVLLFFHGNAGNISHRLFKIKDWVAQGFSVFLVDYRGYGKSEGKIGHRTDVLQDSEAAWEWLVTDKKIPAGKIILYGESLGTHPALYLAAHQKAAAVILEAPFTSFEDLARIHYPFIPVSLIKDFAFSNMPLVEQVKIPIFILHGTRDEICPYGMGQTLFARAPEPKDMLSVEGGSHNDLPVSAGEAYWQKPQEFIKPHLR